MRASNAGFSLLEVLGAIAILGIWFAALAEFAVLGLRNEGRSYRALRASLVADDALAKLELDIERGEWPEIGGSEEQVDDYTIRIDISPYNLEVPESKEGWFTPRQLRNSEGGGRFRHLSGGGGNGESKGGGRRGKGGRSRGGGSGAGGGGQQTPLLSIRVEVAWFEGNSQAFVTRDTFALDLRNAQERLSTLTSNATLNRQSADPAVEDVDAALGSAGEL